MDFTRRRLLRTVGAASFVPASTCLGRTPTQDATEGGSRSGGRDVGAVATPTPPVEDIPEGGAGENFELVGHAPLYDDHQFVGDETFGLPRGSNGDIAVAGDCVYVGSLIGEQPPLIVDVSDPTDPTVVGPLPDAVPGVGNGIEGIEVSGDVLVLDHRMPLGDEHDVPDGDPSRGFSVYDVTEPREPELVTRVDVGDDNIHAISLWRDPENPDRLLAIVAFWDDPTLRVYDLTGCPDPGACDPSAVAAWDFEAQTGIDEYTHEATMSTDGDRIYVPQWNAGTLLLDSSDLVAALRDGADCDPEPASETPGDGHCLSLLNPDVDDALDTVPPFPSDRHHSALKVPGRPYLLVLSEATGPRWDHDAEELRLGSCPGAFTRVVYVGEDRHEHHPSREDGPMRGDLHPEVVGVFGLPEQRLEHCTPDGWAEDAAAPPAWFSPHFATVFPDLAFVTYYGSGLRAIDISNPYVPHEVGYFFNEPVDDVRWTSYGMVGDSIRNDEDVRVGREAPAGPHMMAFSYPVVHDGHVVYADVHSGLYVLEYDGPHADQLPAEGTCESGNPGAAEAGYEPCPPYGETDWTGGSG